MTDTSASRGSARERRDEQQKARALFRETVIRAKADGVMLTSLADATLATLDNADALDAALSAVEAERDGLRQDNVRLRRHLAVLNDSINAPTPVSNPDAPKATRTVRA